MRHRSTKLSSGVGVFYSWASLVIVAAVCLLILLQVFVLGKDAITPSFLTSEPSSSVTDTENVGGIASPIAGTLILTVVGILAAFPISLATAVYLSYYAKKGPFQEVIRIAIDVLSGVPTVVVALFSLAIFTNPALSFLSSPVETGEGIFRAYGKSFLVAGIAMAIMILPFVIKSMTEALTIVPRSYIEGSYALGASKWTTVSKVALPSARQGLLTGVILGMGRIVGDTAIVWLALGGSLRMTGSQPWYEPQNWLSTLKNTGSTLTSYIYYTSPAGEGNNFQVAFGASLVLIVIILLLNAVTALIGAAGNRRAGS